MLTVAFLAMLLGAYCGVKRIKVRRGRGISRRYVADYVGRGQSHGHVRHVLSNRERISRYGWRA